MAKKASRKNNADATIGYEAQLWQMADALRGSMDAAEYKHVVLGLIFLKYISDAFEEQHAKLEAEKATGRRPRGPGRVPRPQHLLGAARGALAAPQGPGAAAHHRPARGRRHGRHRARQPRAQGRAAQGLRPPRARQAAPRPADRHDQQHQGRRRGQPRQGRARPRLRILPLAVRERRGQEGRRVLHAALRGQAAGRDARALPRPGLRPLLRLLGHVRAVGGVHPRARQRATATAARPGPTSRSTARSRTTPPGGSPR